MQNPLNLSLTPDEVSIIVDALEADYESYADVIKEARANNRREDVQTFTEAGNRIQQLIERLRPLVE